jgi:hypothetical protein
LLGEPKGSLLATLNIYRPVRRPTFSKRKLTEFVQALLAAGLPLKMVTMAPDGSISAHVAAPGLAELNEGDIIPGDQNPWDEVFGDGEGQIEIRLP